MFFASSAKLQRKLLSRHSPGVLFPYVDYIEKDTCFILDDGHIGCSWLCSPINGTALEIQNVLQNLLSKKFPDDCWLQCMLFASPDIHDFLQGYELSRGGRVKDPVRNANYTGASIATKEFWQKKTSEALLNSGKKARRFHLYFSFKMPIKKSKGNGYASTADMEEFRRQKTTIEGALAQLYLQPRIMSDVDLLYHLQVMFNWSKDAGWRRGKPNLDASVMLKEQIVEIGGGIKIDDNGEHILMKDKVCTAYSVKTPPTYFQMGEMLNLTGDWQKGIDGIWDNFAICVNVFIPNQAKALQSFTKKRGALKHQTKVGLAAVNEKIQYQKEDFDLIYQRVEVNKDSLLEWSMHLLHFTDSIEEAKNKASELDGYLTKRNFNMVADEAVMLPLMMSCMPLAPNKVTKDFLKRSYLDCSNTVTLFMPLYASWQGNAYHDPLMTFVSRTGAIGGFNPYVTDSNMNMLVCATSGAGKSFFCNNFVSNIITSGEVKRNGLLSKEGIEAIDTHPQDGGIVYIIDVGRSYVRLCEQYSGQFLEFNEKFQYSLQPFFTVDEWTGKDGMADMVYQLVALMAFPTGHPCNVQQSAMKTILKELWEEKGNKALLDDFKEKCLCSEDPRIRDIAVQIAPFCTGGTYAMYFRPDRPPVKFTEQLIVVELEELKSQEHLQKIVLLQMISNIQYVMYQGDKSIRKALIIDEGWEWIKNGNESVAKFLETGWRRFRKYNSLGCLITQSYLDTLGSSAGQALATNSNFKAILMQGSGEVSKLESQKLLNLSESEFRLMETVTTKKGHYSEVFLQAGDAREIFRLIVPRYEQLIYSTDPKEVNLINKLVSQGMTNDEAIRYIIEQEEQAKLNQ